MIEAAEAMGTSPIGIILRVYLLEGLPGIIRVSALTIINVIGLTTMAGAVGAGGLGNLAISRGYNRFQTDVTIVATLLILILVLSQFISNQLIKNYTLKVEEKNEKIIRFVVITFVAIIWLAGCSQGKADTTDKRNYRKTRDYWRRYRCMGQRERPFEKGEH